MPTRNEKSVRETFCNSRLFVGNERNNFQILLLLPAEVSQWFLRGTVGHGASCPPSRWAAPLLPVSCEKRVSAVLSHSVVSDSLWPGVAHRPGVACQAPLSMGILQSRTLEWVAISSSRGSSQHKPRSPAFQADSLPSEPPWESLYYQKEIVISQNILM